MFTKFLHKIYDTHHSIYNYILKMSFIQLTVAYIIAMLILLCTFKHAHRHMIKYIEKTSSSTESFSKLAENNDTFKTYYNDNIFDKFYISVYDDLFNNKNKNIFEINILKKNTYLNDNSLILDIGSGTGHHVNLLNKQGYSTTGIDKCNNMVVKAKSLYPNLDLRVGDATNSMLFEEYFFSHITCFYFTVYNIKNKSIFFQNCYKWLAPGGYFIIHLVDKYKLNSTYSEVYDTLHKGDFKYESKFNTISTNIMEHEEKFTFTNNNIRINKNTLYMESQADIITMIKDQGFIMHAKIDMRKCNYNDQYIYIFKK